MSEKAARWPTSTPYKVAAVPVATGGRGPGESGMTSNPDSEETSASLQQIASRLELIASDLQAASAAHDREAVRLGASELLAEIEPLQREGRGSGKPELLWYVHHPGGGASIWLVDAAATSILDQFSSSDLDWDQVAAAATFAESGIQQLQDAISGQPPDEERLRKNLADTIAHVEERLQGKQLSATARKQLTKQLQILRDIEPK
jgi:hypothetical protein